MRTHILSYCALFLGSFSLPGCGSECVLSDGKCPASCQEIAAGPVVDDSSAACIGRDELLACMEKGANTDDDVCDRAGVELDIGSGEIEPGARLIIEHIGNARVAGALELADLLWEHPLRELETHSTAYRLWVDRPRALFSAWYEMFPRSEGAEVDDRGAPVRHGTFTTAAKRLPGVAAMGFDVVYLPPIHPIGRTNRKGRDNALVAEAGDLGSPWAIGATEGGHDAVHPRLGTLADFRRFVAEARALGLEVALAPALGAIGVSAGFNLIATARLLREAGFAVP